MADQYVASDKRTGVEVSVTGDFPNHPDDRMRIARTTTLFTRLTSTLLATENESERRAGFRAVETQLELADALIRRDMEDVRRLVRTTMESMGVTQDQLQDLARQLHELGGMDDATAEQLTRALGLEARDGSADGASQEPEAREEPPSDAAEPAAEDGSGPAWPPAPEGSSGGGDEEAAGPDEEPPVAG